MNMSWFLLLLCSLATPFHQALAIDPGMAQGSLEVNQDTIALTHGYAQIHDNAEGLLDRPKELRILLTDREVSQDTLCGIVFLPVEQLAKEGRVRGLLLQLDPKDHHKLLVTLLYPPTSPGASLMTQTLSTSGQKPPIDLKMSSNRVGGEIQHTDESESSFGDLPKLVYSVRFSAPLFHEPAITADLKGKAAQDSPQVRLLREKAKALAKGDFEAVRRLSSERANQTTAAFLAQAGPEVKAFAKEAAAEMEQSLKNVQRVVVRGERAVVILAKKQWSNLVREAGEWKSDD
jgi:hypothetical protein